MQPASFRSTRGWIAGILLLALLVRALFPQGFMPAAEDAHFIQICPEGLPQQLAPAASHHHHGGNHWVSEHCAFGAALAGGLISHHPPAALAPVAVPALRAPRRALARLFQLVHLPQARGPPAA